MIITVFLPVYRITEYFIMSYLIKYLDDMLDYGSLYAALLFLLSFVDKVHKSISTECCPLIAMFLQTRVISQCRTV